MPRSSACGMVGVEFALIEEIEYILHEPCAALQTWYQSLLSSQEGPSDAAELESIRDGLLNDFYLNAEKMLLEMIGCCRLFFLCIQHYKKSLVALLGGVEAVVDEAEEALRPNMDLPPQIPPTLDIVQEDVSEDIKVNGMENLMKLVQPCINSKTMLPLELYEKQERLRRLIQDCSKDVLEAAKLVPPTKLQSQYKTMLTHR